MAALPPGLLAAKIASAKATTISCGATRTFRNPVFPVSTRPLHFIGGSCSSTGVARIQGGIWPTPPEALNLVQSFIAVEDVSASVSRAMAMLLDPQGIPFGAYHRSGR